MIKNHVLLERATMLTEAADAIKQSVNQTTIEQIVATIPDDWLTDESSELTPTERRAAYVEFLSTKLANLDLLTKEAADAQ